MHWLAPAAPDIVPVLYTAVGKQTVMPEHIAVPAITTLGYAGILAGPAVIGFVAHGSSLSTAFVLIAVLLAGVAISGKILRVQAWPSARLVSLVLLQPAVEAFVAEPAVLLRWTKQSTRICTLQCGE